MKKEIKITILFLLFGMILSLNFGKVEDPDLFWHLKTGEEIAAEGFVSNDPFSWTFPGKEWLNHEWLTQFIFYTASPSGNLLPLIFLKIILITATFGLLFYLIAQKSSFTTATVYTGLGAMLSSIAFTIRPWIFSYFLLVLFLLALEKKKFYFIPIIFLLWINFHGIFIFALGILFVEALNEIIVKKRYRLSKTFAASIGIMLINPNGLKGLLHPFSYLYGSTNIHLNYIMEWASPDFKGIWGGIFIIFIFLSIFALTYSEEKPEFKNMFLFFVFMASGLLAIRNIPFFVIITGITVSKSFDRIPAFQKPLTTYISIAIFTLITVISIEVQVKKFFNDGYIKENTFPSKPITDKLQANTENLVHPYDWGGYLIYHNIPVFIDGRADFYPGQFLENFFLSTELKKNPENFLKKYKIKKILWKTETPFFYYLNNSSLWQKIYSDEICAVFKKNK
ncbi:MAG: hypothetical protein ACQEQC_00355 [Elusimicrobiota bacterium]